MGLFIKSILKKIFLLPKIILSRFPVIEYYLNLYGEQLFIDQLNLVCRNKQKVIFIEIGSSDLKEAIILSRTNQNIKIIGKIYEASRTTYQNLLRIRDSFRVKNLEIFNRAIVPSKLNYRLAKNKYPHLNKMIYSKTKLKNKSKNILLSDINDLHLDGIHKLVKMDIEGLEEELLISNLAFIKKLSDISFAIELHQSLYKKNIELEKVFYELLENKFKILFIEISRDCNQYFLNKLKKNSIILKKAGGRFLIKSPPIECIKYIVNTDFTSKKNYPYFSNRNIRSITLTKN